MVWEENVDQKQLKRGLAKMLKGGVIMDVVNEEQAMIAEKAGACAVMALERVPYDIVKSGGVARMCDPKLIKEIMQTVKIPVMAKCRIGHLMEAKIIENIGADFIDESEVLTIADQDHHIQKSTFGIPFVCGCQGLSEALIRINEGASMIRTKGHAGTGNVCEAVKHIRRLALEIKNLSEISTSEKLTYSKSLGVPLDLIDETIELNRLPVVTFAAGGISTPADAALVMNLGVDGVFVGSGIFKSEDPIARAAAIVNAVSHYDDINVISNSSFNLGKTMP